MKQYLSLVRHIKKNGVVKADRTGTGTKSYFGYQMRHDLSNGFPLLTTKRVYSRGIIHELLWFLSGSTNIKYLVDNNVKIWNEWPFQSYLKAKKLEKKYLIYSDKWKKELDVFIEKIKINKKFAKKWGELGPIYGKQWMAWDTVEGGKINQIEDVINMIKNNPNSRRIIVSGWNVGDLQKLISGKITAPPPCHTIFQFYVAKGRLSCQLYQRSADVFLGVPFNIASYALLTMMVAQVCGLMPGEFIHTFGDVHIYRNHYRQVNIQLKRKPRQLPEMAINPKVKKITKFKFEDFELKGYSPYPPIKAPISL